MTILERSAREFTAQRFEFRCEVAEGAPVTLNQHKGSAIRGALFNSLRKAGCARLDLTSCKPCALVEVCPISFLLATVDNDSKRGMDVPRPFTVQPPLGGQNIYPPGAKFNFGLTLFAGSVNFLPYLVMALQDLEREGLGAKTEYLPGRWRRGRLRVREIMALNPLTGEAQSLFSIGKRGVEAPVNPVTSSQVAGICQPAPEAVYKMEFTFHTPTRLIEDGKPLTVPKFPVLVQRLFERLTSLAREFSPGEFPLDFETLMGEANQVVPVESRVQWEAVRSYSQRQRQDLSLGGFTGKATFAGKVSYLLPLLVWGQLTHVGKDATKGNGWYSLSYSQIAN